MYFQLNRVYERGGDLYRLIGEVGDNYQLIDVLARKALPISVAKADLQKEANDDKLCLADDPWEHLLYKQLEPEHLHLTIRDKNYAIIKPIVEDPEFYDPKVRGRIVLAQESIGVAARSTQYRYIRRYLQRGMSPNALLPDFENCGGKGKPKTRGEKKLGRPRIYTPGEGEGLLPHIKEMMRAAIRATLAAREYVIDRKGKPKNKHTRRTAYKEFVVRYCFGEPDKVDNGLPTYAAFKHFYDYEYQKEQKARDLVGEKYFNANLRPLTSSVREGLIGPGQSYQIDSTPINIGVTDEDRLPLGRPTLYLCVDEYSSLITGFSVMLMPPSFEQAVRCMTMAVSEKPEVLGRMGLSITNEDWPSSGLPSSFFADLGSDFKTRNQNKLVSIFKPSWKNSGAGQPEKRSVVEKKLDQLHAEIVHRLPGVVSECRTKKRGGADSRLNYTLLLSELNKVVALAVMTLNKTPIEDFDDDGDFPDDLATTPVNIWNWGIAHRTGSLPYVNKDKFWLSMMPRMMATRSKNVLKLKGIRYVCPTFSGIRQKDAAKKSKYEVVRDKLDTSVIHLVPESGKSEYVECPLHPKDRRYEGMSWQDALHKLTTRNKSNAKKKASNLKGLVEKAPQANATIKSAEAEKRSKTQELSKSQQLSKLNNKEKQRKVSQSISSAYTPEKSASAHNPVLDETTQDEEFNSKRTQRFMKRSSK